MGRDEASDLLPGTLDLLILKTLVSGAMHGYGIVQPRLNPSAFFVGTPGISARDPRHSQSARGDMISSQLSALSLLQLSANRQARSWQVEASNRAESCELKAVS